MCGRLTFRRFLPNWLVFASSVGITVFVAMSASVILNPPGPGEDDFPPMLVLMTSVLIYLAALGVGLVLAPFRRFIIGPRFPFVRRGYLVMAALPLPWFAAWGLTFVQRAYMFVACELLMAVSAAVFVWLGGWFGAFDEEERGKASQTDGDASASS